MMMLGWAILLASLLGSMHCVGMCGPIAMWASGTSSPDPPDSPDSGASPSSIVGSTALYHVGRLLTYVAVGALAGWLGDLVNLGGNFLGWQLIAARLAGVFMIAAGIIQIWRFTRIHFLTSTTKSRTQKTVTTKPSLQRTEANRDHNWSNLTTRMVLSAKPLLLSMTQRRRAFMIGALTALLPCGWLYLFAVVAGGTAGAAKGAFVMAAFWLGTVPALTTLVVSFQQMSSRFRKALPIIASIVLITAGCYTSTGRGFSQVLSLDFIDQSVQRLPAKVRAIQDAKGGTFDLVKQLDHAELPCCRAANSAKN